MGGDARDWRAAGCAGRRCRGPTCARPTGRSGGAARRPSHVLLPPALWQPRPRVAAGELSQDLEGAGLSGVSAQDTPYPRAHTHHELTQTRTQTTYMNITHRDYRYRQTTHRDTQTHTCIQTSPQIHTCMLHTHRHTDILNTQRQTDDIHRDT